MFGHTIQFCHTKASGCSPAVLRVVSDSRDPLPLEVVQILAMQSQDVDETEVDHYHEEIVDLGPVEEIVNALAGILSDAVAKVEEAEHEDPVLSPQLRDRISLN